MTIYASRTAESMNIDPTPYRCEIHGERYSIENALDTPTGEVAACDHWEPRPEFTPKTTYPPPEPDSGGHSQVSQRAVVHEQPKGLGSRSPQVRACGDCYCPMVGRHPRPY